MPADVFNAFNVAFFFVDTALAENTYLQPQKLHSLMFLSQSYYAVAFEGRKLMPAVFVADERGPLEPNIYMAFSKGRPDIDTDYFLSPEVIKFLGAIWGRFGNHSTGKIIKMIKETDAFKSAKDRGNRAEIKLDDMQTSFNHGKKLINVEGLIEPKIYRTQTGKPVTVKAWTPGGKAAD